MKSLVENSKTLNRAPAWLDLAQSLSGLALGIFMWTHLLLVASILLGKDAMQFVTDLMEAKFLTDGEHGYPVLVTITGIAVSTLFIVHAGIALRKFPSSWAQHREFRDQMSILKHADTKYWYLQAVTGFVMFFLGSVHLYIMTTQPDSIGPYASSDRFWTDVMWPLYLVLLFAVEIHAAVGMYRLAVKWGIFDGKDPVVRRKRLKLTKNLLTVFFLTLGLMSFAAYMKIGYEHRERAGERYVAEKPAVTETVRGESR
jgi:fumarate reductase subunit C